MRAVSLKQNNTTPLNHAHHIGGASNGAAAAVVGAHGVDGRNMREEEGRYEDVEDGDEEVDMQPRELWHALDLSNMGLRHLSPSIMNFTHLTALYLSHNALTDLPTQLFTHLTALIYLDLSHNHFTHLPSHIGDLQCLEELLLYNNKLVNLPWTIGRMVKLKNLVLGENPIIWPPMQVIQKGTTFIVNYLRDRMPPPPPPTERKMIPPSKTPPLLPTNGVTDDNKISVFCYNVLAEKYATPESHSYTPCWALEWGYRKERILNEMLCYGADVLCLQEVEGGAFHEFFQPEMNRAGYSGIFRPKSRARTMDDWEQVDGCAIFYKNALYDVIEDHLIEFQAMAMAKHKEFEEDPEVLTRIMTKDNIALVVVLRVRSSNKKVVVVNTHIHWDPQFSDVKLMQVQFMMERLAAIAGPGAPWDKTPVIICGDFNSMPGSGPYELLTTGRAPALHPDLFDYHYGTYSHNGFSHPFSLDSAYSFMGEPPFTNYTLEFVGVLDYIFYSKASLKLVQVLQPVEINTVKSTRLPNPYFSSDHVSLLAELQITL